MTWILHDTFTTKKDAKAFGEGIVEVGLVKGIKIIKGRNKLRSYELYILPLNEKSNETME